MHVPIAPLHLLVLDRPLYWNMNSTQVTAGQRLLTLLLHNHQQEKVFVHELIPYTACVLHYFQTAYHWAFHHLHHLGEGHQIYLPTPPPGVHILHLRHNPPVGAIHVIPQ